jgi:hypothetical protein
MTLTQTDFIIKEQEKEIEGLKEELELSNLERCPHDYNYYRAEWDRLINRTTSQDEEIEGLKRALNLACVEIGYRTGTCPVDQFDWETKKDCQNLCDTGIEKECWKEHYIELATKGEVNE